MITRMKAVFSKNTYFMRIMISVTLGAVLLVGALTLALYVYGKQALFSIQSKNNEQVLKQARFNIELMNASVQNTARYLFVNPDTTSILNDTGGLESDEVTRRINRITNAVIVSNSFIHSIGFYNNYQNQLYYAGKFLYYDDEEIRRLIARYPDVPRMKPIFRTLDNTFGKKIVPEGIITYIMYETSGDPAKIDAAVAINVNAEWIVSNIKQIGMVNDQAGDIAYIFSAYGGFWGTDADDSDEQFRQALLDEYEREKATDGAESGSFEKKLAGADYVVSYMHLQDSGLTIFKLQSARSVYHYLQTFRLYLLAIFALFVILGIFISIKVSGMIYRPIRRLVNETAGVAGEAYQRDEIAYLSSVYSKSLDKLHQLKLEKLTNHSVVRDYFVRKALTEPVSREEFEEGCARFRLPFRYDSGYYVSVVKLDDYAAMRQQFTTKEIELYKFAAMNIFEEVMKAYGASIGVSLNEDDGVVLLQCTGNCQPDAERFASAVHTIQTTVRQLYAVSITIAIGDRVGDASSLPPLVRHAFNLSKYRFLLGKGSFISNERIASNITNEQLSHSVKWETILIDNMHQSNMKGVEQALEQIKAELVALKYESAIASVMQLMAALHNELFSTGKIALREDGQSIFNIWRSLWDYESLEDLFDAILITLEQLLYRPPQEPASTKNIADAVLDMVQLNYTDNGLCADQIAIHLKMNPRKLAKTFKETEGLSIADYINEVRLKKAAELLAGAKSSVVEVISQVGYENESYFYRIFKRRYGMTPKEFALRFK